MRVTHFYIYAVLSLLSPTWHLNTRNISHFCFGLCLSGLCETLFRLHIISCSWGAGGASRFGDVAPTVSSSLFFARNWTRKRVSENCNLFGLWSSEAMRHPSQLTTNPQLHTENLLYCKNTCVDFICTDSNVWSQVYKETSPTNQVWISNSIHKCWFI